MKFKTFILEEFRENILEEIPKIILLSIVATLIVLWAAPSILKIWEFATVERQLNDSCITSLAGSLLAYFIPVLKLSIVALLFVSRTFKLGLVLSLFLFGIYTLYIIYMLNLAPTVPWSCISMFKDTTWDEQLRFNLAAMVAIIIALIISTKKIGLLKPERNI